MSSSRRRRNVSLYGNYIEGLVKGDVAPAFTSSGQPVLNAGQVFAPYVSKQKEIGAKYESDGGIGATVALFETTKPLAFVRNGIYGNNGEQRNRGSSSRFSASRCTACACWAA